MKSASEKELVRLLVIEDNAALVLAGLRNFFRPERDQIRVTACVSGVDEAIRLYDHETFDVILLDLIIPGTTPGNNVTALKNAYTDKPIVIYTSLDSNRWRKRMFNLGVHAFVHKNDPRDVLKRAIMDACEGKITYRADEGDDTEPDILRSGLTENKLTIAEKEMLVLLAEGLRYKQIGRAMNLKEVAVETTIKRIRAKFGANSTTQLIHLLTRQGLM